MVIVRNVLEEYAAGQLHPVTPAEDDTVIHRLYNEALIRRLEDKMLALERANGALALEISERKRAEVQLLYDATILASINDSVIVTNMQGNIEYWNPGATEIFGYTAEEMMGKTPAVLYPDLNSGSLAADTQNILAGQDYVGEWKGRRKDGETVWINIQTTALRDAHGRPAGFIGVAKDITDRKRAEIALTESEERFRSTFEQAAVGIAHVAPDGRWLKVNRKLCDIVGYTKEELLRTDFQSITHPEDLDQDLSQVRRMLTGEIREYRMEKRYIHKTGSVVWINLTVSLIRDDSDHPLYFISVVEDRTERKLLEQKLLQAQKMESLGTLASGIAHDFNNILGIAIGYSKTLQKKYPDHPMIAEHLAAIDEACERGASLVRQLLTFARKTEPHFEMLNLNDHVAQLARMLKNTFPKTITIETSLEAAAQPIPSQATNMNNCNTTYRSCAGFNYRYFRAQPTEANRITLQS